MKTFHDVLEETGDLYAPRFELTVDGDRTVDETTGLVSGLSVDATMSDASEASFTLTGAWDPAAEEFAGLHWGTWSVGSTLTVDLGYGAELQRCFYGHLESLEPRFGSGGEASVEVRALDPRSRMDEKASEEDWSDATVGEAARDVLTDQVDRGSEAGAPDYDIPELAIEGTTAQRIRPAGDRPGVAPGDLERSVLKQNEESDLSFLEDRADDYGYELFFRGETLHYRRPSRHADPELRLEYGQSLRSLTPQRPGEGQSVGEAVVTDVDRANRREIRGVATRDRGEQTVSETRKVESTLEAEARAHALLQSETRGPTARVEIVGLPEPLLGRPIEVDGLGSFSGRYYVQSADHSLDDSGYTTTLTLEKVGGYDTEE